MTEKYLNDTSIWMDLYEDRKGFAGEPLCDYALKLFIQIKAKKYKIVISDLLLKELELHYSLAAINGMMNPFEDLIEKVIVTKEQRDEAKKISLERNVPPNDFLHAILARDNKSILVTRDNHFKQLKDISNYHKPEELI